MVVEYRRVGTATTTETDQMTATNRLVKRSERCGDRGRAMVMYLGSSVSVMIMINVWTGSNFGCGLLILQQRGNWT